MRSLATSPASTLKEWPKWPLDENEEISLYIYETHIVCGVIAAAASELQLL